MSQSRSPLIHNYWFSQYGVAGAYVPLSVAPDNPQNLKDAITGMRAMGFAGCNLTMPHKVSATALVDTLDPVAQCTGALNVLVFEEDGRVRGANTDGFGWTQSLLQQSPSWRADAGAAVVVGAGGVARAVIFALLEQGAPEIRIVNRHAGHAAQVMQAFDTLPARADGCILKTLPWEERAQALAGAALLVNCTNQGMYGQEVLDLELTHLDREALVSDTIYVPLETDLVRRARARGNPAVGGLGMLLHQARPAFHAWSGVMPSVTQALWEKVLATF